MKANRGSKMVRKGVVVATLALLCAPAIAWSAQTQQSPTQHVNGKKRVARPVQPLAPSIGSFTPAAADPRFGQTFGRGGLTASGFQFTPSQTQGSNRRVTVAVRTRAGTTEQVERSAMTGNVGGMTPYAYNLGVSVGWKRFAVSSDYSKVDLGNVPGSHEMTDVAVSYAGKRWSTRLALASDHSFGDVSRLVDGERGVSVDLGGSYSINSRLDVTGGVRYKMERDRLMQLNDDRRDSQAVYVGTAFRF